MRVTEDQARKMRCPKIQDGPWCVATGCMAWRFVNSTRTGLDLEEAQALEKDGWSIYGFQDTILGRTYKMKKQTKKGYCGLAGEAD